MGGAAVFEAWREVWASYGLLVTELVVVAFPGESERQRHGRLVEGVATGIVGESAFDPLETMVVGALRGAGRAGLRRAGAVLVSEVDSSRSFAILASLSVSTRARIGPVRPPAAGAAFVDFDEIRMRAEELFLERGVRFAEEGRSIDGVAVVSSGAVSKTDPRRGRGRRRWLWAAVGVLCGVVVASVSVAVVHRPAPVSDPLVYVEGLGSDWRVVGSTAFVAPRFRMARTLVQRYVSGDGRRRVSLAVSDDDYGSAERDFSSPTTVPIAFSRSMAARVDARASEVPKVDFSRGPSLKVRASSFWAENGRSVSLFSEGMSTQDVNLFMRGLRPSGDLLADAYGPVDGMALSSVSIPSSDERGPSSVVVLERGAVAIQIMVSRIDNRELQDLRTANDPGDERVTVPLGDGRTLRMTEFPYGGFFGSFDDGPFQFQVSAGPFRTGDPGPRTGQRFWPVVFRGTGPSGSDRFDARDRAYVFDLLRRVRVGSATEWQSLNAAVQSEMARLPIDRTPGLVASTILTIRRDPKQNFDPGVICTPTVCAPIYYQGATQSADLIVDGRWWHFEKLGAGEQDPEWETSPESVRQLVSVVEEIEPRGRWYGVDFGTDIRLARTTPNGEILGRPLAP